MYRSRRCGQGNVPGEHSLFFEGGAESIEFTHRAYSRHVFAIGAVCVAEWIASERPDGPLTFDTFLERNTSWMATV